MDPTQKVVQLKCAAGAETEVGIVPPFPVFSKYIIPLLSFLTIAGGALSAHTSRIKTRDMGSGGREAPNLNPPNAG